MTVIITQIMHYTQELTNTKNYTFTFTYIFCGRGELVKRSCSQTQKKQTEDETILNRVSI